jgi:small GTP-binding protein
MDHSRESRNIAFIGRVAVGKTSLIRRLVTPDCELGPYRATIGATRMTIDHEFDGKLISFDLVDTAGEERHMTVVPFYLRSTNTVAVCFDPTESDWLDGARKYVTMAREISVTLPIILIATKADTWGEGIREICEAELAAYGFPVCHTSALSGSGIDEAKEKILRLAVNPAAGVPDGVDLAGDPPANACPC